MFSLGLRKLFCSSWLRSLSDSKTPSDFYGQCLLTPADRQATTQRRQLQHIDVLIRFMHCERKYHKIHQPSLSTIFLQREVVRSAVNSHHNIRVIGRRQTWCDRRPLASSHSSFHSQSWHETRKLLAAILSPIKRTLQNPLPHIKQSHL